MELEIANLQHHRSYTWRNLSPRYSQRDSPQNPATHFSNSALFSGCQIMVPRIVPISDIDTAAIVKERSRPALSFFVGDSTDARETSQRGSPSPVIIAASSTAALFCSPHLHISTSPISHAGDREICGKQRSELRVHCTELIQAPPKKGLDKSIILEKNKLLYISHASKVIDEGPYIVIREDSNNNDSYILLLSCSEKRYRTTEISPSRSHSIPSHHSILSFIFLSHSPHPSASLGEIAQRQILDQNFKNKRQNQQST